MKFKKLFIIVCFFSFTSMAYASPDNLCADNELSTALFGICNAYINVDCREELKHDDPQCIALRKNFFAKSKGKNIDDILAISNKKTIVINAFYSDFDTPAEAGAWVFVNGEKVGNLNSEGSYQVSLPVNAKYLIRVLEPGLAAGQESIRIEQAADDNQPLNIRMTGGGLHESAKLMSTDINNQILDKNFQSLMLSFINGKGEPIIITKMRTISVFLEKNDDDSIYVDDLFIADANGNIVLQDVKKLREILSTFGVGKIIIRVTEADDDLGLIYYGEMGLYLGSFEIDGKVKAPESNQSLNIEGVQIKAIFLGSDNKLVLETVSDANGEFNFPLLPSGNWSIEAATKDGNIAYTSSAGFSLNGNKLLTLNLLSMDDLIKGLPFFEIESLFTSASSQISSFNSDYEISKIERKEMAEKSTKITLQQSNDINTQSILFPPSASVFVKSSKQDSIINARNSIFIFKDTKTVTLTYRVSTQEYPTYVLQQSEFNDQWRISVYTDFGNLTNIVRQVNSQLLFPPKWRADGTTGIITEEFDVSSLTKEEGIQVMIYAASMNIGDSSLPTSVRASVIPGSGLKIKEIIRDTVSPTKGNSDYFSIPKQGENNHFQRTYTLKVNKPIDSIIKNVKVDIINNNKALQTIVNEAPSLGPVFGSVRIIKDLESEVELQINVSANTSTINSAPPLGHNIVYRFLIEAELDSDLLEAEKDSEQNKALWKLPDSIPRKGYRDPGGDGWAAKGTYEWLISNSDKIARVDDISGEHARNLVHQRHFKGTDIDTFHFVNLNSAGFNGEKNYLQLKKTATSMLNGDDAALQTIKNWISVHRNKISTLTALNTVAQVISPYGNGSSKEADLPDGWAETLMTTGKLTSNTNITIDTKLGLWHNKKVDYNNEHNSHLHIDLDDNLLNNKP